MILDTIMHHKKTELSVIKRAVSLENLKSSVRECAETRSLSSALQKRHDSDIRIIAEVKKASPSKGIIRSDFDPLEIAREYEINGAAAISVLTDEKFFSGSLNYLTEIKNRVSIPVFRKDFVFDPYQIYESRVSGADALLLIAAVLSEDQLAELHGLAESLHMDVIVEVHTRDELQKALHADIKICGINNRNLYTFDTDIRTTIELVADIPDQVMVVTESGISTRQDIIRLIDAGVDAFLIGESLVRAPSPGKKLFELICP